MPHDRLLGAHLVISPAQLVLDRLREVFNPVAQAVELIDLVGTDVGQREGGGQVPGGLGRELRRIQGGRDQADALVRAIAESQL